jgi:hypothetical protein
MVKTEIKKDDEVVVISKKDNEETTGFDGFGGRGRGLGTGVYYGL